MRKCLMWLEARITIFASLAWGEDDTLHIEAGYYQRTADLAKELQEEVKAELLGCVRIGVFSDGAGG